MGGSHSELRPTFDDHMKVAFISSVHGHEWPGSEYLWAKAASDLLERGESVFARLSADLIPAQAIRRLREAGLVTDFYRLGGRHWQRLVDRVKDPLHALKAFQPGCVVISAGSAFDVAYQPTLARFLIETKTPYILICHFNAETFWVDEPLRQTMRAVYRKAASIIFVSIDNQRITERQLAIALPRAQVIRPPLPLQLEAPIAWPESNDGIWRFACVARLETRWKGQDVLFETLVKPEWNDRNWRLTLYGEGMDRPYLEALAAHYGLTERIHFAGFVVDRTQIWAENHIQLFPTRGEGGPMTLTEGMIAGRIAVITDCGNAREYVTHGEDGFLADFATSNCFGAALESAWEQRGQWKELGVSAHEKIARIGAGCPSETLITAINHVLTERSR